MTVYRSNFSYGATSTAFTPGATPQDVFTLTGSSTSNVYITKIKISNIQTAEGVNAWYLAKRSTANSGGTSATPTIVPFNSQNPSPSAVARQYTANPSLGTLVGYIWGGYVYAPTVSTASARGLQGVEIDFEDMFNQPITLLNENEVLAINFKGAALPAGLSVIAQITWYEVSKT